jgi:hypothetical protein
MSARRVCIVGDSHIAALKLGLAEMAAAGRAEVDFFGAPGHAVRAEGLTLAGGVARPTTPHLQHQFELTAGRPDLPIAAYDAFVWVSLGHGLRSLFLFNHTYRRAGWSGATRFAHLLSEACFDEAVAGLVRAAPAFGLIRQFRAVTDRPMFLVPHPLPWEGVRVAGLPSYWSDLPAIGAPLADAFARESGRLADELAVALVPPPAQAVVDGFFTRSAFKRGAVRLRGSLNERHEDDEPFHMNAAYGRLVMAELLRRLGV